MAQTHWVMDVETLSNVFLAVFEHYKESEVKVFTVGPLRNDLPKLLKFLDDNVKNNEWHISFNGLAFDSQIIQFILINRKKLLTLSGEACARIIYNEAQVTIENSNQNKFPKWSEKDLLIKQIDLFKLNHWDNPNKLSSLKSIQCAIDWYNVLDMPIPHTKNIESIGELQEVAKYCRNDVSSTKAIYNRCRENVALRVKLSNDYQIPLYSASEPKISREIFLHFLSKETHISKYELRQQRTFRKDIKVKDIILPYVNFSGNLYFENLLKQFQNLIIDPNCTKDSFKYEVNYKGLTSVYGLGGIHGARKGVFTASDEMCILTVDVKSYYPNLAIRNKWSPAHLPSEHFCKLYEWFYDERVKIPKKDIRNYVYKIILNSTFGMSIDKNSFLYDSLLGMRITINGQLLLTMLYVNLVDNIPGAVPLMQNTDGLEMMIPIKYKDSFLSICKQWEKTTQLELEHDEYQKMITPDVNNYIAIYMDKEVTRDEWLKYQNESPENLYKRKDGKFYMAKTKCKGRFEFKDRALHKNKSYTVVSKALYDFFVHGIKPEEYLKTNRNIFDYCGYVKAKGQWAFKSMFMDLDREAKEELLQKTLRYIVSKKGCKIIKYNKLDGRTQQVEAGTWMQTLLNLYQNEDFDSFDIDYRYYLSNIHREINSLDSNLLVTQYSLF